MCGLIEAVQKESSKPAGNGATQATKLFPVMDALNTNGGTGNSLKRAKQQVRRSGVNANGKTGMSVEFAA
ncbi:hypothetical protein PCASD_23569 [Puccinia coronata f. sp. avenae]|uniref:Uncharacterized protein n=1 Tax=Puccinia coronata f. sp. avenae TaxID=200324 RepID=A0A2N5SQY4_9BASI|nr:hypothetical protein PCASD_23569 [Puccinia coronata f. sp. avenae]